MMDEDLIELIEDKLELNGLRPMKDTQRSGEAGTGCAYLESRSERIFWMKMSTHANHEMILRGEFESLNKITATKSLNVPIPIDVVTEPYNSNASVLILPYIESAPTSSDAKWQQSMVEDLFSLHQHNQQQRDYYDKKSSHLIQHLNNDENLFVEEYGFDNVTCCGSIQQNNAWVDDWMAFYGRNRLHEQINLLNDDLSDREVMSLWSELQTKLPSFFIDLKDEHNDYHITPSLLHGDLWSGNVFPVKQEPKEEPEQVPEGFHFLVQSGDLIEPEEPVKKTYLSFDPASFYGHFEYDFGIMSMLGGFQPTVLDPYFEKGKKSKLFDTRQTLYMLFHQLNHVNHGMVGFLSSVKKGMKSLNSIGKRAI